MPQSLWKVYLHLVFSTKNRVPWLLDKAVRNAMHQYLGGTCGRLDSPSVIVGGVDDHVHILCQLSRTRSIADIVRELKRESSKWIKEQGRDFAAFHWQDGYGAFSVSASHLTFVTEYIANQEAHHATELFQDEFRGYLKKYDIEFDERYVWD
jgi:putative transposase